MKKTISLLLASLILFTSAGVVSADNSGWKSAMSKTMTASSGSNFMLLDVSGDGIPELFCPSGNGVISYYYDGNALVQASSDVTIPYEFVKNVMSFRDVATNEQNYIGQTMHHGKLVTYRMSFLNCAPILEVIAEENPSTGSGDYKGTNDYFTAYEDVSEAIEQYLDNFTKEYILKSAMTLDEVRRYGKKRTIERLFQRYEMLSQLSDDISIFTETQREKIKKTVSGGKFRSFDKVSILDDNVIFVEYGENNSKNKETFISYDKKYSLVSKDFDIIKTYQNEHELDTDFVLSLTSSDARPSNFMPDYGKTSTFRGIDDYVTYFSSLLGEGQKINENGKKEIANFMEYAVNICSRAEIKANNNVLKVTKSTVSIISENAQTCMSQLQSVCQSKGFEQLRTAKTVPELACKNIDFEKPIRCEFEKGIETSLKKVSGIRIMLKDNLGIYINTSELSVLESECDTFAIEFTQNKDDYSIVFTDKSNEVIGNLPVPVWFIVPATSNYSSVLASFDGGTENRGGQYDAREKRIEFSATRSGNYQVVEEDITINDIDSTSFSANQAIRFLVSKGVLEVDNNNNFHPDKELKRYDFTKALVGMFYVTDDASVCSYSDVPEKSRYYPFIATAEKMGMSKPLADGKFGGNEAVTNEYMLLVCGKVLAEKKGYKFPDNYVEYLMFSDKTEISASAMPYIAVAVQCGLVENNGELSPSGTVSREKGAQILYKTFTLLYDTSPVTTSFSAVVDNNEKINELKDLTPVQRGFICVLVTFLLAVGFWLLSKKRKPFKENK